MGSKRKYFSFQERFSQVEDDPDKSSDASEDDSLENEFLSDEEDKTAEEDTSDEDKTTEEDTSDEENESESEDASEKGRKKVTTKLINEWTLALQEPTPKVLQEIMSAFAAAIQKFGTGKCNSNFVVGSYSGFNEVVQLCIAHLPLALQKLLPMLNQKNVNPVSPGKSRNWNRLKKDLKNYFKNMLELLKNVAETTMLDTILRHLHKLIQYIIQFSVFVKHLMKKAISLWSSGEETTRILSFLCIHRLVRMQQSSNLGPCVKKMYTEYVKNCKFTSPNTLPMINFMQHSLVEIFLIDEDMMYQHAFVFIRQLAIHLRNALTVKKKDTCQAVYNWQYIHCLELWTQLFTTAYPSPFLEPLIYPLTQVIIGTIKLLPTTRYIPLRFHCARTLNKLSAATGKFIPVLPFLLEVFELVNFNQKHTKISIRPLNFACILKLSKAQFKEKSFKDGVIDQLFELILIQFEMHSNSIGFPEIALPSILQLKEFLKKCKVANYCKQMKQIVTKVEENYSFIIQRRKAATINLADKKAIDAWEQRCKESEPPLSKYYATWKTLHEREMMHEIAEKGEIVGFDDFRTKVTNITRGPRRATSKEREDFAELFKDVDHEDDLMKFEIKDSSETPAKKKKGKKGTI